MWSCPCLRSNARPKNGHRVTLSHFCDSEIRCLEYLQRHSVFHILFSVCAGRKKQAGGKTSPWHALIKLRHFIQESMGHCDSHYYFLPRYNFIDNVISIDVHLKLTQAGKAISFHEITCSYSFMCLISLCYCSINNLSGNTIA